jgi:hypothetical protein
VKKSIDKKKEISDRKEDRKQQITRNSPSPQELMKHTRRISMEVNKKPHKTVRNMEKIV